MLSISEARAVLGELCINYTDQEVQDLLEMLEMVSNLAIDNLSSRNQLGTIDHGDKEVYHE